MSTVILISGFKRAGKDFVGSLLQKKLPSATIASFATPLKDIIATTLNISLSELDDYKNEAKSILIPNKGQLEQITDFRTVLQIFGTDGMKKWFGDDVWVELFLKQDFKHDFIIIPDWRFKPEVKLLPQKYQRVITVRVEDHNIKNEDVHSSETALLDFDFDYILDNTAKDESINEQVKEMLKDIKRL